MLEHQLFTDADPDRPAVICDQNRSVVLGLCKVCGLAEVELDDYPECPGSRAEGLKLQHEREDKNV